jgi:hypothetical protein
MAYPCRFRAKDEEGKQVAEGLVEAGRLVRDGDGYKAAEELVAAMARRVRTRAERAALN